MATGWGSSPHTRGAPRRQPQRPRPGGIIPAYAGSTAHAWKRVCARGDHPRIRGEHTRSHAQRGWGGGSSPHTRGAHPRPHPLRDAHRIIPAYAGSTHTMNIASPIGGDHPRIRGEHAVLARRRTGRGGSSPHTRGARRRQRRKRGAVGIIPAYAGSTNPKQVRTNLSQDHPRIRGEHHQRTMGRHQERGSSPHTRGAQKTRERSENAIRIIPAYAGSTATNGPKTECVSDHPRIRGEHPVGA